LIEVEFEPETRLPNVTLITVGRVRQTSSAT
jgi:hypothetical protein